jgi:signal transduction histidine kinase
VERRERSSLVPHLRLDELVSELQARLQSVLAIRDRVDALLEAVVSVGSELELESVLRRIVEAAVVLVDARYGALGVIGENGRLAEFIPVGLDEAQVAAIERWPEGRGLLGELVTSPRILRIPDISAHPNSSGFPAGHPPMRTFLGAPVQVRGKVYGHLYLTDKHGGEPFDEDDEALLVALAGTAGAAVDKARLYTEARRQQQWLRASGEVTRRLLFGDPPAEVLQLTTDLVLEMTGADLVVLAVPRGAGDHLVIEQASGPRASEVLGLALPVRASASGVVMASGTPLSVVDFTSDDRVAKAAREHLGLGPAVVFPLGPPGQVRGVLTAGRSPGAQPLSAEAVEMATTFAAQAGIGLELAEHRRDAEQVAVFADRDRIARDLHDLVIQRLFATGMSLQAASGVLPDSPAAERVRQAVESLDETIRDIRAAIFTLQVHPADQGPGLRVQILAVADEMTQALGFAPSLRLDGRLDTAVSPAAADAALVALREALSNAARHAKASQVDVTAEVDGDLLLVVQDNGAGFTDTGRRSGLGNLAARAAALGGTMRLLAAEGGGTRMEWRVPVEAVPPGSAPGQPGDRDPSRA